MAAKFYAGGFFAAPIICKAQSGGRLVSVLMRLFGDDCVSFGAGFAPGHRRRRGGFLESIGERRGFAHVIGRGHEACAALPSRAPVVVSVITTARRAPLKSPQPRSGSGPRDHNPAADVTVGDAGTPKICLGWSHMDFQTTDTEQSEAPTPTRHRVRCKYDRSRWHRVMQPAAARHGVAFPTLQEVADLTPDAFEAIVAQVAESLAAVAGGIVRVTIPAPEIQIQNFRDWQLAHGGGSYFVWPPEAMENLRRTLIELGPGAELSFDYAMSCGCRLANGRVIRIDRNGNTKG